MANSGDIRWRIVRGGVTLAIALLLSHFVTAAPAYILDPDASSGFNSDTWEGNLLDIIDGGTTFNTIQTFEKDGDTLLWIPWFDSSTSCAEGNLKTYGSGTCAATADWDTNVMVSDEFSEVMIALSVGNTSHESYFDAGYNTLVELGDMSTWGSIPYWVLCRDGSAIEDASGADTASDATHRFIIALYQASTNEEFTTANRTKYKSLANTLVSDSLTYEIVEETHDTENWGSVDYWLFGGRDAANTGINNADSGVDVWTGYHPDAIIAFIAACEQTGTSQYCDVAEAIVYNALTAANYSGGTTGGDFSVAPFNYQWDDSGSYMEIMECSGCNGYHFSPSNPQWDDSDAPRYLGLGHALRAWELSQGSLTGAFSDLNDYLTAWHASSTLSATQSCLQYSFDGTCFSSLTGGIYENGLGAGAHTYQQTSTLDDKLNEALGHYSFATHTYDGSSCGNGLMYRGVRLTKALLWATGQDTGMFNASPPGPTQNISFSTTNPTQAISVDEPDDQVFSYTLTNPDSLTTTTTWYLDGTNQTGAYDSTSFTFSNNYTAAGTYNVTVVVVSSQNTISYEWDLTVNDVPYVPQNISFDTTSPAQSAAVTEGSSQTFSYTLTNPDSLATLTTWFLDGANQTGVFNDSSMGLTLGVGSYNISVSVASSQNTLNYEWDFTVNAAPIVTAPSGGGGGGGGGAPLSQPETPSEPTTESPAALPSPMEVIRDTVSDYLTGSATMSSQEFVETIREYYEVEA